MMMAPAICEAFVQRLMRAMAVHAATADSSEVREGLNRLDAYRCASRGEKDDEEIEAAQQRAIGLLSAWCMDPPRPIEVPVVVESADSENRLQPEQNQSAIRALKAEPDAK